MGARARRPDGAAPAPLEHARARARAHTHTHTQTRVPARAAAPARGCCKDDASLHSHALLRCHCWCRPLRATRRAPAVGGRASSERVCRASPLSVRHTAQAVTGSGWLGLEAWTGLRCSIPLRVPALARAWPARCDCDGGGGASASAHSVSWTPRSSSGAWALSHARQSEAALTRCMIACAPAWPTQRLCARPYAARLRTGRCLWLPTCAAACGTRVRPISSRCHPRTSSLRMGTQATGGASHGDEWSRHCGSGRARTRARAPAVRCGLRLMHARFPQRAGAAAAGAARAGSRRHV